MGTQSSHSRRPVDRLKPEVADPVISIARPWRPRPRRLASRTPRDADAARHASTASGNGKNASLAQAAPTVEAGPSIAIALATAWRAASTRDVWPLPIPTRRRSRTSTIAFEVTPRTSRQARSRSSCSSGVGARRVAHVQVAGASADDVRRGHEDGATGRPDRPDRIGRSGRHRLVGCQRLVDQDPEVRLRGQHLERLCAERRRDDDLEEDRGRAPPRRPDRPRV